MKKLCACSVLIVAFPVLSSAQLNVVQITGRLEKTLRGAQAMQSAGFFTQFWRVGGGLGFDTCISFIEQRLASFGFQKTTKGESRLRYHVQEDDPSHRVWIPIDAQLSMEFPEQRILQSFSVTPLMLCRNSFSQDITGDLIYVKGGGAEEDYEKHDVTKKIVLCDAAPSKAFLLALKRGALGIISAHVPEYNRADLFPDLISHGSIPYDSEHTSFGLKVSTRTAEYLKRLLSYTQVTVNLIVKTEFTQSPIKTLTAEITGNLRPLERILIVAHLDHYKPGANDNASGSATLLEIARAISNEIRRGMLPHPARTLTFLWVDEIQGSEFWIKRHATELEGVKAVFGIDMVGGDPAKTGGTFRVERAPDPSVIWMRRPDHHSGWGVGSWPKDQLVGTFLNDFFLSVVEARAKKTGWKIEHNPFEGGSDHVPFLRKQIPAVLSWHYPDYFYHSSMDDIDKLSPAEMQNAGIVVGTAALALAYGSDQVAREILRNLKNAATVRLHNERGNSAIELGDIQVQDEETRQTAQKKEREIIEAWGKWFEEALESVRTIPVNATQGIITEIQNAKEEISSEVKSILAALGL